jgi:Transcriptional regulators containing an AAA-type ATPase domain and a DNA-binding domain
MNEVKLGRKNQIYTLLQEKTENLLITVNTTIWNYGLHTAQIADHLQIDRANVSRELNQLVKEALVIKISGKPVFYFARNGLEANLHLTFSGCTFPNKDAFMQFIASHKKATANSNIQTRQS